MDSPGVGLDSMCSHDLWSGATQDRIGEDAPFFNGVEVLVCNAYKLVVSWLWDMFPVWFAFVDVHY